MFFIFFRMARLNAFATLVSACCHYNLSFSFCSFSFYQFFNFFSLFFAHRPLLATRLSNRWLRPLSWRYHVHVMWQNVINVATIYSLEFINIKCFQFVLYNCDNTYLLLVHSNYIHGISYWMCVCACVWQGGKCGNNTILGNEEGYWSSSTSSKFYPCYRGILKYLKISYNIM